MQVEHTQSNISFPKPCEAVLDPVKAQIFLDSRNHKSLVLLIQLGWEKLVNVREEQFAVFRFMLRKVRLISNDPTKIEA